MRTAEFDRDEVLRQAMAVFRQKGFAAASMQDLVAATGLHPGSLYCAFQNKRGILLAVLERYAGDQAERYRQLQDAAAGPLDAVHRMLQTTASECALDEGRGACLQARIMMELGQQDAELEAHFQAMNRALEERFRELLEQARAAGELHPTCDSDALARLLTVGLYGLRSYARLKPGADALNDVVERLLASLPAT